MCVGRGGGNGGYLMGFVQTCWSYIKINSPPEAGNTCASYAKSELLSKAMALDVLTRLVCIHSFEPINMIFIFISR